MLNQEIKLFPFESAKENWILQVQKEGKKQKYYGVFFSPATSPDNSYPRNNFSFSLFTPFGNFGVDLFTDFWLDLACVTREEGKEALCATVYDINFMKCDSVHHLFSLLQLSLWALNKLGLQKKKQTQHNMHIDVTASHIQMEALLQTCSLQTHAGE